VCGAKQLKQPNINNGYSSNNNPNKAKTMKAIKNTRYCLPSSVLMNLIWGREISVPLSKLPQT
jgi:hypothetical protein